MVQYSGDKTILIVSYAFPPMGYVGVHRTLKYCKYLGSYGWSPIVLTVRPGPLDYLDARLCEQVPARVRVFRTRHLDTSRWLRWLDRLGEWRPGSRDGGQPDAAGQRGGRSRSAFARFLTSSKRLVDRVLGESPDSHWGWMPFALIAGAHILATQTVDIIYCSSPPHSSQVAAFLLARLFRKPYVLDFRDPWLVAGSRQPAGRTLGVLLRLQGWLKAKIVAGAAKVICVSIAEQNDLMAEFPSLDRARFACITNGYDPDDFRDLVRGRRDAGRFVMTHAGTIYPGTATEFFPAIELVLMEHPELNTDLRVNLLGEIHPEYRDVIDRLVRANIVSAQGFQAHATALQCVLDSDVLLVLQGGEYFLPSHLPSKIFEYLYAGKPILAVAPTGELSRMLEESGACVSVCPNDRRRLATAIWHLYQRPHRGQDGSDRERLESFERRHLARSLASVLDDVPGI